MGENMTRIAIADDDAGMRLVMRKIIERQDGYELVGDFDSGSALLEAFDSIRPEVCVLDVEMPGMNGIATLEKIRQHKEYSSIPVMFLTADATEDTVIAAGRLGADGYIKKPYMPQDFLERVENVL